MTFNELKAVFAAVRLNVQLATESKGESVIVGVEGLTEKQLDIFDAEYDREMSRLNIKG